MSLLDQAIIDAKELRETALRSAEQSILERYAPEVRKAVESMLNEQDELDLGLGDEMMGGDEGEKSDIDAPLAATEGEKLCPCPDEGEDVVISVDFDELKSQMDGDAEGDDREDVADMLGAEPGELGAAAADDEEDDLPLQEVKDEEKADLDKDGKLSGYETKRAKAIEDAMADEDDSAEDDKDEGYELSEKLVVDLDPVADGTGWFPPNKTRRKYAAEMALAQEQAEEAKKETEAVQAALEKIQEDNSQKEKAISSLKQKNLQYSDEISGLEQKSSKYVKNILKLKEKNGKYSEAILNLEGKIGELLLINSRLLYANRVLESVSLNERQKKHLVEAISKSRSPEEAKTIFESLKDVVGSVSTQKRQPKSLREAVQTPFTKNTSKREQNMQDNIKSRMQKLAGIQNNNIIDN